jgi:hypothetical protein
VDAPPANTFRMLISKQRLHEILGAYVLRSHGFSGDVPSEVGLLTVTNQDGVIQQVRVEVAVKEPPREDV